MTRRRVASRSVLSCLVLFLRVSYLLLLHFLPSSRLVRKCRRTHQRSVASRICRCRVLLFHRVLYLLLWRLIPSSRPVKNTQKLSKGSPGFAAPQPSRPVSFLLQEPTSSALPSSSPATSTTRPRARCGHWAVWWSTCCRGICRTRTHVTRSRHRPGFPETLATVSTSP